MVLGGGLLDRVIHGDTMNALATLARRHARDDSAAVGEGIFDHGGCFPAGNALHQNFTLCVKQHGGSSFPRRAWRRYRERLRDRALLLRPWPTKFAPRVPTSRAPGTQAALRWGCGRRAPGPAAR